MTDAIHLGGGHCCICSGSCMHIGGPYYCERHNPNRWGDPRDGNPPTVIPPMSPYYAMPGVSEERVREILLEHLAMLKLETRMVGLHLRLDELEEDHGERIAALEKNLETLLNWQEVHDVSGRHVKVPHKFSEELPEPVITVRDNKDSDAALTPTELGQDKVRVQIDRLDYFVYPGLYTGIAIRRLAYPPIGEDLDLWRKDRLGDYLVEDASLEKIGVNGGASEFFTAPKIINAGMPESPWVKPEEVVPDGPFPTEPVVTVTMHYCDQPHPTAKGFYCGFMEGHSEDHGNWTIHVSRHTLTEPDEFDAWYTTYRYHSGNPKDYAHEAWAAGAEYFKEHFKEFGLISEDTWDEAYRKGYGRGQQSINVKVDMTKANELQKCIDDAIELLKDREKPTFDRKGKRSISSQDIIAILRGEEKP